MIAEGFDIADTRCRDRRLGCRRRPKFVEIHPGAGATGVELSRYDSLPQLGRRLETVLDRS